MAKKKYARFSLKLCEEICIQVTNGESIKKVLAKSEKYPTFEGWCKWKRKYVEVQNMYYNAIQDKSEGCIDEIHNIMDKLQKKEIDSRQARVLIDTQKWMAAKFYPKMYGNNSAIDLTSGGKEIQQQVTVFKLPDNGRDSKK